MLTGGSGGIPSASVHVDVYVDMDFVADALAVLAPRLSSFSRRWLSLGGGASRHSVSGAGGGEAAGDARLAFVVPGPSAHEQLRQFVRLAERLCYIIQSSDGKGKGVPAVTRSRGEKGLVDHRDSGDESESGSEGCELGLDENVHDRMNQLWLTMREIGFEYPFPVTRLRQGHGMEVCTVLRDLVTSAMEVAIGGQGGDTMQEKGRVLNLPVFDQLTDEIEHVKEEAQIAGEDKEMIYGWDERDTGMAADEEEDQLSSHSLSPLLLSSPDSASERRNREGWRKDHERTLDKGGRKSKKPRKDHGGHIDDHEAEETDDEDDNETRILVSKVDRGLWRLEVERATAHLMAAESQKKGGKAFPPVSVASASGRNGWAANVNRLSHLAGIMTRRRRRPTSLGDP